jgi:hypothetical protein
MVYANPQHAKRRADYVEVAIADVATANADATYGQPEADLINALKASHNALLAALRTAGIILP